MKRFLLIAAFAVALFAPCSRADYQPQTATEAVFYAQGVVDTNVEITPLLAIPATQRISFRAMASNNALLAALCAIAAGEESDPSHAAPLRIASAYFAGRADAFLAVADLLGEP